MLAAPRYIVFTLCCFDAVEIEPLAADNDPRCGRACLFPRYAGLLIRLPIVGHLSPLVGSKGS
jgi:hypothetical protein